MQKKLINVHCKAIIIPMYYVQVIVNAFCIFLISKHRQIICPASVLFNCSNFSGKIVNFLFMIGSDFLHRAPYHRYSKMRPLSIQACSLYVLVLYSQVSDFHSDTGKFSCKVCLLELTVIGVTAPGNNIHIIKL
jgi:hypothetical protein